MIQEIFEQVKKRLDSVVPTNVSSHLPSYCFESWERDILRDMPYTRVKPNDYPSSPAEERGFRSIKNAANAQHLNMRLRVGTTTLHIRERNNDQNIDAIVLMYLGELKETVHLYGPAEAHKLSSSTIVLMLENGIISTIYIPSPDMVVVDSCYPKGKEGYAAYPYPTDKGEIVSRFEAMLNQFPQTKSTKAYRAIPDMVMFAVDTCKMM